MANERTIIITGKSQLSISPDMVRLTFKILTQETAYSQALDFLSDNAKSLIDILTSNGFNKDDVKTTRYSIHRWTRYQNGQEQNLGYEGEHQLYVEFKIDNTRINDIINTITEKVPCVSITISYSCSQLEKHDKKLIQLAIKDANEKAEFIAKNSNVKLKQIININYSTQPINVNFGLEYNHLRADKCFANARVPEMTPEDKLVEKTINMVWEIE